MREYKAIGRGRRAVLGALRSSASITRHQQAMHNSKHDQTAHMTHQLSNCPNCCTARAIWSQQHSPRAGMWRHVTASNKRTPSSPGLLCQESKSF